MIPVNEPLLGEEDLANVIDCVKSGWISSAGTYIDEFERAWARECGVRHGVAVSNGTTALQIAVEALDLEPGDEVIMPTFTIISCALAVVKAGLVPVLVDSDPDTWGMRVDELGRHLTPRTRAIMPVHMYGHPVDMDPLLDFARANQLRVIEDAAEVHGAEYLSRRGTPAATWKRCGGMSDLATFSFYANKLITTGEGGMVVTDDDQLADRLRSLRNLCFRPPRRFFHTQLGYNFRMTNIQAALGVAQTRRLRAIVERKREIARLYTERLSKLDWISLPQEKEWAKNVYWIYGVVIDDRVQLDAESLAERLKARGVETRPYFLGMHEQPVFHDMGLFRNSAGKFPVSERIARRGLYVPSGLAITNEQIAQVCDAMEKLSDEL